MEGSYYFIESTVPQIVRCTVIFEPLKEEKKCCNESMCSFHLKYFNLILEIFWIRYKFYHIPFLKENFNYTSWLYIKGKIMGKINWLRHSKISSNSVSLFWITFQYRVFDVHRYEPLSHQDAAFFRRVLCYHLQDSLPSCQLLLQVLMLSFYWT